MNRKDLHNRHTDRPIPIVPDYRKAPKVTRDLTKTLEYLADTAGQSDDLVTRHVTVGKQAAALVYYQTIVDPKQTESTVRAIQAHDYPRIAAKDLPKYLADQVIPLGNVVFIDNFWETREALSRGVIALFVDGVAQAITMGAKSVPHRAIEPPLLESSTRGPQNAFVELIDTNIGLMRSAFVSDTLTVKEFSVGYRSKTRVALLYQHDVVNPTLVSTAIQRIEAVHVDKLTGSATLEQRIVDNHWTLFPLTRATSRVDNCIKEVGQGKALIMVDGDPTVLLIPGTVVDFFQTMEDDQHTYIEATLVRWLRMVSFVMAFYLPALYVAFVDFNPELMPHVLSLQIARSREGVPFNAATEVLMMQLVIEIIREAALRMPKVMGQTIGIVGGLVLGEASVQAGLVSNILIVVIALTAVATFVMPSYEFATVLRILTWVNILGASIFGFFGILLVVLATMFHVASLKSFGVSFLDPIAGEHLRDFFLDGMFRAPIPVLDKRAQHLHDQETTRGADYTDPVPHPMLEKDLSARRGRRPQRRRT